MRELDPTDAYELAIIRERGHGLVVWRADHSAAQMNDASIIVVVAGEEGPDLVCYQAWVSSTNGEVYLRSEGFPVEALEAKIPLMQWHYHRIEGSRDDDIVTATVGTYIQGLWKSGSSTYHTYLGLVRRDGERHLVVATLDRTGAEPTATVDLDIAVESLRTQIQPNPSP